MSARIFRNMVIVLFGCFVLGKSSAAQLLQDKQITILPINYTGTVSSQTTVFFYSYLDVKTEQEDCLTVDDQQQCVWLCDATLLSFISYKPQNILNKHFAVQGLLTHPDQHVISPEKSLLYRHHLF